MQSSIKQLDARVPQSEIKQVYDGIAGVYDLWGRLTETHARNRALELAEIQDGQHILEVAVGTGLAFYEIARRNPAGVISVLTCQKGCWQKPNNTSERSAKRTTL